MERDSKILITGHKGLVGSALVRELLRQGYENLFLIGRDQVDLSNPIETQWYFSCTRPEYVFHCAARVGGIKDNIANPLDFFLENTKIQLNVFQNAAAYGVKRLLFLSSSCCYPRNCPQPIREEYLLTGPFERAVEAYGLAKVAGVKMCEWYQTRGRYFTAVFPCNLYGPGDSFNPQTAHVVPGMIARMHAAKEENAPQFEIWGDGSAKRELLFADDLACGLITIIENFYESGPINAGSGQEFSIAEIAQLIRGVIGYKGEIVAKPGEPTGTPRKVLNNDKIFKLGWQPKVGIVTGLEKTYASFLERKELDFHPFLR